MNKYLKEALNNSPLPGPLPLGEGTFSFSDELIRGSLNRFFLLVS